jgi:hypothetical protein
LAAAKQFKDGRAKQLTAQIPESTIERAKHRGALKWMTWMKSSKRSSSDVLLRHRVETDYSV